VHKLACRLVDSASLEATLDALYLDLLDHFAVPHVAVRLWNVAEAGEAPEFAPAAAELKQFVEQMTAPYCGHHAVYETQSWFGEAAAHVKSFAILPLRRHATFGVIVLASEDPRRFYPEMGTLHLARIGELTSAALGRFLTLVRDHAG
jgi:uncharacterized protein YigA (DUF484 family)